VVAAVGHETWRKLSAGARTLTGGDLEALSPIVILAPHPDDETLGCGGLLASASQLGLDARVAFLTDGAASHVDSPTWPKTRLAEVRKAEALAALAELGVSEDRTLFLGWPDSAPSRVGSLGHARSIARLLDWFETFAPRSLWAPWSKEAHCDHEAAAYLADAVCRASPVPLRRMDFLVWGWQSADLLSSHGGDVVWTLPCKKHIDRRRRALSRHRTQTEGLVTDASSSFRIPPELAALTERPSEIFLERL
jgi:LmbE family N-acetylglucosaminyl deacetylase